MSISVADGKTTALMEAERRLAGRAQAL